MFIPSLQEIAQNIVNRSIGLLGTEQKQVKDLTVDQKNQRDLKTFKRFGDLDPEDWVTVSYWTQAW